MRTRIFMFVLLVVAYIVQVEAADYREVGFGLSNTLYINTGGAENGGLSSGLSSVIYIETFFGDSGEGVSEPVIIYTLPYIQAVSNLALIKCDSGVALSWNPISCALSYRIYRSDYPTQDLSQMQFIGQTVDADWVDSTAGNGDKSFYVVITIGY